MKKLKLSLCTALALGCVFTSTQSAPTPVETKITSIESLAPAKSYGDFYYYYYMPSEYLSMYRLLENGSLQNLSSTVPSYNSSQASDHLILAQNRAVVHQILSQVVPKTATEDEAVRGIYDFLIYNFVRYDTDKEVLPTINNTNYNRDMVNVVDKGSYLLSTGIGGCTEFSNLLYRMLSNVGIPSFEVFGEYINRDGSSQFHGFNRAQINGEWYWYDVDVEGSVYRRGDVSSPIYYLYKKDSEYWLTNHSWSQDVVDAEEAAFAEGVYRKGGDIFTYELPTEIFINGNIFQNTNPIYGYVDMDSPYNSESLTLLPFQELVGILGGSYTWNGEKACLEVKINGEYYEFVIGSQTYWHSGVECLLSMPIQTINDIDYISSDEMMLILGYGMNVHFYQSGSTAKQAILFQSSNTTNNTIPNTSGSTNSNTNTNTNGSTNTNTNGSINSSDTVQPETVVSQWDTVLQGTSPWAYSLIEEFYEMGFLDNVSDFQNRYREQITREEVCRLLVNVYEGLGGYPVNGNNPFTDTDSRYVVSAYHLGIATGKSSTLFYPTDKLNRQEFALMMYRYGECYSHPIDLNGTFDYEDQDDIAQWAADGVMYAKNLGFLAGSEGKFLPNNNLTIEEAMVAVYRMAEYFTIAQTS